MSEWTQERVDLIKRTVCPSGLTNDEFALFIEQCKRSGLDPLLKEAFCVPRRANVGTRDKPQWVNKHEFQPSETGMLARAERFPDFRGVTAAAVFASDTIEVDQGAGTVSHRFNPTQRKGAIIGAWAKLERKDRMPIVVWLAFDGYAQSTPLWAKIPATMIEKCARVAALRKAYPEAFGGLYVREEMPAEEFPEEPQRPALPASTGVRQEVRARAVEAEVVHAEGTVRAPSQAVARTAERVAEAVGGHVVPPEVKAMSDDTLASKVAELQHALATKPNARNRPQVEARLALLSAELEARIAADTGRKPAREPGADDEVPF